MSQADTLDPSGAALSATVDEPLYEIVDGSRVELPPMGIPANSIATRLSRHLGNHADEHDTGQVIVEALFILRRNPGLRRRPDLAFVSAERWPLDRPLPEGPAWDVVPDLAVEVVSPTDPYLEVVGKVRDYFDAGVRLVWLVLPSERLVYVYTSPTTVEILDTAAELDGGSVVPGFLVPLAKLFPPMASQAHGAGD